MKKRWTTLVCSFFLLTCILAACSKQTDSIFPESTTDTELSISDNTSANVVFVSENAICTSENSVSADEIMQTLYAGLDEQITNSSPSDNLPSDDNPNDSSSNTPAPYLPSENSDDNAVLLSRDFTTYDLVAKTNAGPLVVSNSEVKNTSDNVKLNSISADDLSFQFYKTSSRYSTYDDVELTVENDKIIIYIPFDISDQKLTRAFVQFSSDLYECSLIAPDSEYVETSSGNYVSVNSLSSNATNRQKKRGVDLTKEPKLRISGNKINQVYDIKFVRKALDLPILYLSTDTGEDVTDRYNYVSGNVVIDNSCGMIVSNGSNYAKNHQGTFYENSYKRQQDTIATNNLDGASLDLSIRGRGNASWWKFDQKSYMLKFDENVSLFGMTNSDHYSLVSTYGDPSLIRNCVAMDIATCMDHLEYTTGQIPVDVFLNGTYLGVYTLSEKIDTDIDKVNLFSDSTYAQIKVQKVDDIPFLLECGGYVKDSYTNGLDYFYTAHSPQLFVKYPDIEERYDDTITYINNYMNAADQAMTRGYGYEDYIDLDSWIDWFIVMELTNNTDSALCRSTYLYKRADGKLMIGPVWDFDMAFGNYAYDNQTYEYWATAEPIFISAQNHYMSYLYKSNSFMLKVQERWDEKKDEIYETAMDAIDKYAEEVAASRIYNNHVRGSGATSYQVEAIRSFIKHRYNWIDMSIHMSDFNRHEPTESVPIFEPEEIPLLELDENALPDEMGLDGADIPDDGQVENPATPDENVADIPTE